MQPPLVDNAWTIHAAGIIPEPRGRPLERELADDAP
jgi:hypothetical protein